MYKIISGTVVEGKGIGKTIGFPTANIKINNLDIEDGTYKLNGVIDGKIYSGVGAYFKDLKLFEPHFFDIEKDLYGKKIEVIIFYKIRNNKKFESIQELKKQIEKDVKFVKNTTDYAITFGTFDIFHPGHEYYLKNAKKYGDKLITVVARDENVEKIKGYKPQNNEEKRLELVKKSEIADIVKLGGLENHLKWIKYYKPKAICLGYDQEGFLKELEKNIKNLKFKTEIIRLKSYKKEKYKSSLLRNK